MAISWGCVVRVETVGLFLFLVNIKYNGHKLQFLF